MEKEISNIKYFLSSCRLLHSAGEVEVNWFYPGAMIQFG